MDRFETDCLLEQNVGKAGQEMYGLMEELYPICRSITGNGVRKTLGIINRHIPITLTEVPTGTEVFDWTVPKEWNINDAYIKNSRGEKIVDFKESNLHVVNYSAPVKCSLTLEELKKRLHTIPAHPEWIPYVTSYYKEYWGFCISHNQFKALKEDTYEVFIGSSLDNGSLTYGELYIEGETREEILFSTYLCHPSLCNDNLSGVVLLVQLAKLLQKRSNKYSYRFLFVPETIGAISWLYMNEEKLENIKCGLVATCLGDSGISTYKRSKRGNALIDIAVEKVLRDSRQEYKIMDFFPYGSDERQYSSQGFKLDMGSLMRTPYGNYPEYHTSADNLKIVSKGSLGDSLAKYLKAVYILENNKRYRNLNPKCEPQLGKRGIYEMLGGQKKEEQLNEIAMFWVLSLSDGTQSLLDISIRSGMGFEQIKNGSDILYKAGLLHDCDM